MFRKILLSVDGSPGSMAAVHSAMAMAGAFHAELCVLSVVDPFPFTCVGPDLALGRAHYIAAARQVADEAISKACQMIEAQGLTASKLLILEHLTWKGILDTANMVGADLVVMGSHGVHGLQGRVLGGVTNQVLQHSGIPVLVVHDIAHPLPLRERALDVWRTARASGERLAQSHRQRRD